MVEPKTVELDGKRYTLTASGWIDSRSYLRVDIQLSRKLDRLAAAAFGKQALYAIDTLLEQARNARAERQFLRAEHLVRQALHADNRHEGAQAILCGILRDRGLPEQALRETEGMLGSLYPPLLISRAAAYCDLAQWTEALQELEPVLAAGGSPYATVIIQRIQAEQPAFYRRDRATPPQATIDPRPEPLPAQEPEASASASRKHVTIYTGASGVDSGEPGPHGYAAILYFGDVHREVFGGYRLSIGNRMEMMAAIAALACLKYPCKVTIYSTFHHLVDSINRGWANSWRANGWVRMRRSRVQNVDLWETLLESIRPHDLTFVWIDRPAAVLEHIRCRYLADQAISQHDLAIDHLFEASHNEKADSRQTITEPSRMMKRPRRWKIRKDEEFSIHDILCGRGGQNVGQVVYIIRYWKVPAYVGLTRSTPAARLQRHIKEQSNVGVTLSAEQHHHYTGWSMQILHIDGDLEAAERHFIRTIRPPLNIEENNINQETVEKTVRIFRSGYRRTTDFKHRPKIKRS